MDSFEISLFDEVGAFYAYGLDATMDDAYGDELAIVPHVKHEIFAIAPTLECPIILLKSPTPENFPLIKAQCDGVHLSYDPKNRVENNTRVLVGHEQYDLCDSYILMLFMILLKIIIFEAFKLRGKAPPSILLLGPQYLLKIILR